MNWTKICIVIATLFDIIPGLVHFFAADGGAGSIAGIVLEWNNATSIIVGEQVWNASNYHKQSILVMFTAIGLLQVKIGTVTTILVVLLPQNTMLYILTLTLLGFQILKIIADLFQYRNIHSIAPYAPGGYKPPVVLVFYVIATILQLRNQNPISLNPRIEKQGLLRTI